MKLLIALVLCAPFVALAAPESFCVTKWWPRACAEAGSDECLPNQPAHAFVSMDQCMGKFAASKTAEKAAYPTPSPDAVEGFCVLNWYPRICADRATDPACVVGSPNYETEEECEGVDGINENGFCTTSWWPKACAPVADGPCIGNEYPPGGFASMQSCIGDGFQEEVVDPTLICVTNWWPRTCTMVGNGGCVTGSTFHDTMSECTGIPEFDGPGYCVSSWWPKECVELGPSCIGWYPPGGYPTSAECMQ